MLSRIGIHKGLVVWVNHMLASRIVISEIGNSTIKREGNIARKGNFSSLLAFVVYELFKDLKNVGVTIVSYADYMVFIAMCTFPDIKSEFLQ